jgi:hypothetical protein
MTTTETDPRRVRLAEIEEELAEIDRERLAAQAAMPEYRIENVGNGEIAARVQRCQSKLYECDSRHAVLKATKRSILSALDGSVTREARVREEQILGAVRTALAPFVQEMEQILEGVRECRAGDSQTPTWRQEVTAADIARVAVSGGSLVSPTPEDLDSSEWSPSFRRER